MNKVYLSLLVITSLSLSAGVCMAEDRDIIFQDDFSDYTATEPAAQQAELAKKWSAFSGHWYVKDGTLHQDAGSFDYGIVARGLYLRCDYRIETKVRLVGGGAGAGFYWNVFNQVTGDSGNMLRYDGNNPIMFGWMRGRGFLGTGGATGDLRPDGKWHDFRMDVNNTDGTFDLYWDGKQITSGAIEYHRSGYVGLECSLGHCEFDDVVISVAKGADWRAAPSGTVNPEWVSSLAILPDGNIVYPVPNMHRLQIVTPDGKLVREFGKYGQAAGEMNVPMAVTVDKSGNICVAEYGNSRVQIFDVNGKSLNILTPAGDDALKNPLGVAVTPDGKIWVSDSGNNRIVRLTGDGRVDVNINKAGQFNLPWQINCIEGKLYVSDSANHRIQIIDPSDATAEPKVIDLGLPVWPHSVAFDGKNFYVATGSTLIAYDPQWKELRRGAAAAEQAVVDKDGMLVVADAWNKKIVFFAPAMTPVAPKVSDITSDSAVITWKTDVPTPTQIIVLDTPVPVTLPSSVDYTKGRKYGSGAMETDHKVELTDLKSATRHTYAIVSPTQTIPAGGNVGDFRFATLAPKGEMAYTEVQVAVLCYGNVTFKNPDGTDGKPVIRDEAWFNGPACKEAGAAVQYFYWANSRFRFYLNMHYLFVTRPVDFAFLGSSSEEVYKDLKTLADSLNMEPSDFGGVITIGGNGTYAYPWPTPWWGGKLTYTTGCCFTGGGGIWLLTHEFHHVTEGWMYQCGVPGADGVHGYNSADGPWVHPGRFGEDFSFLAHTLKFMPPAAYVNCPFGKVVVTADKDGDGVPDEAPNTPWDEKRAGTSPDNKFSYGNGLDDLQNLTAGVFNPTPMGVKNNNPMLTKNFDFTYPFALFDYKYERPKKTPTIDGKFNEKDWDIFAKTPNAITPKRIIPAVSKILSENGCDVRMNTYLNWDDDNVYLAFAAPYKFNVFFTLDCNADGFFHGKDNVGMTLAIPRDENAANAVKPDTFGPAPGVTVWNNIDPVPVTGYPGWTNELFNNRDKIKWTWTKADNGWYVIRVAVPKTENVGLVPHDGKEMGVHFWCRGYLPATEKNPDPMYQFEMFDRDEYGPFKLVK